jgi:hypothetical protein
VSANPKAGVQHRLRFDFEIGFGNGGDLRGRGFRLDTCRAHGALLQGGRGAPAFPGRTSAMPN